MPIAPGRTFDRPQHHLWPYSSQMPQRVLQHPLLQRDLRARVDMLHRAATARAYMQSGVRAAWAHSHRRLALDRNCAAGFVARFLSVPFVDNALAGKSAFDEDRLAVTMCNAAAILVQRLDFDFELFAAH